MWFVRAGTRVQGPFTEDQLRSMRKRGQFSPIHQVSLDRVRWESAASLVQMLDGPLPVWQPRRDPPAAGAASAPAAPTAADSSAALPVASAWFYLDAKRQQMGPVAADEIIRRLASREIAGQTMVCKAGDTSWRRLSDVGEFAAYARRPKNALLAVLATAALALVACGIFFAMRQWGTGGGRTSQDRRKSSAGLGTSSAPAGGGVRIKSLDDTELLEDAVGRVQMCHRTKFSNGTILEDQAGHGTGFCITPSGYMLTNRHVVEGFYAERDGQIAVTGGTIKVREELVPVVFFKRIRCPATVVHVSTGFDFAILKVERTHACPYFGLSGGDDHRIRTEVAALGFPGVASTPTAEEAAMLKVRIESAVQGALQNHATVYLESSMPESAFVLSVEDGRVSKLDKESKGWQRITHSAKIFTGNSGGPLVDTTGKVLGINTALQRDLKQIGKDAVFSDGNIYFAYSTGQFRREIEEHVSDSIEWLPNSH